MPSKFKQGEKVSYNKTYLQLQGIKKRDSFVVITSPYAGHIRILVDNTFIDCPEYFFEPATVKTPESSKLFFSNFNRELRTYDEVIEELKDRGGTVYEKIAEVNVEYKKTLTVNKLG